MLIVLKKYYRSLNFLVKSLTDVESEEEGKREIRGAEIECERGRGKREKESRLHRKHFYTCLILYFRRKFYFNNIIICTVMKKIITICRECLLNR